MARDTGCDGAGMSAPTEAEIRDSIDQGLRLDGVEGFSTDDFGGLIDSFRAIMDSDLARVRTGWAEDFNPNIPGPHPGTLWADMRPSEGLELHSAMQAVLTRVLQEATAKLVDGCVAAALAFGERHPDIPRGHWPTGWTDPDEAAVEAEAVPA